MIFIIRGFCTIAFVFIVISTKKNRNMSTDKKSYLILVILVK